MALKYQKNKRNIIKINIKNKASKKCSELQKL